MVLWQLSPPSIQWMVSQWKLRRFWQQQLRRFWQQQLRRFWRRQQQQQQQLLLLMLQLRPLRGQHGSAGPLSHCLQSAAFSMGSQLPLGALLRTSTT